MQRTCRTVARARRVAGNSGHLGAAVLALRQGLDRPAVRRIRALDSVLECRLQRGHRRHQSALHLSLDGRERPVRRRVVDRHPGARPRILRGAAPCRDRDDRAVRRHESLSLLRVLGADDRSDVPPHRRVGRSAPHPRGDQVPAVHARRQRADARRTDHSPASERHVGLPGAGGDEAERSAAILAVRRLHGCVCRQGADVSRAHLAAGRSHRGADGRQRDPRGNSPQDGRLRTAAHCAADPSRCRAALPRADAGAVGDRNRVRRVRHARADGCQAADCVLEHQPHGIRDARDLYAESKRNRGRNPPDGEPRDRHRRAVPVRRHDLRAHAYTRDRRIRRSGEARARLFDVSGALLSGGGRPPRSEFVRRRISHHQRRLRHPAVVRRDGRVGRGAGDDLHPVALLPRRAWRGEAGVAIAAARARSSRGGDARAVGRPRSDDRPLPGIGPGSSTSAASAAVAGGM